MTSHNNCTCSRILQGSSHLQPTSQTTMYQFTIDNCCLNNTSTTNCFGTDIMPQAQCSTYEQVNIHMKNMNGITIDSHLSLDQHVSSVCRSSYFHLCALRHIRSMLTYDMAKSVAVTLVSSRLDYANSVLFGISASNINKIQ